MNTLFKNIIIGLQINSNKGMPYILIQFLIFITLFGSIWFLIIAPQKIKQKNILR